MLEPEQEMTSAIALEDAEAAMQGWQEKWDAFNQQSAEPQRQAQVQQSRIQQLEQSIERLAERQRRLAEERQLLAADPEDAAILELSEDLATRDLTLEELHMGEEQAVERLEQLREALQNASQAQQHGRLASLEALQQAALDPDTGTAEWLRDQQLTERPRLAEGLSVEAGWELAVETVLGADLQAVLVDDFDGLDLAGFQQGDLRLLSAGADAVRVPGSLLEKVESTVDLSAWLGQVFPVENLDEALARRTHLSAGQSLISRDGYWVGRHFLRVRRASEAQSGVLARGQELQRLGLERDEREATLATLEEQLLSLREQQSQQEDAREQLRRRVQDETPSAAAKVKVEQLTLRRARLDEELAELAEQRAAEHEQLGESRLQLQDALDAMAQDTEQREVLQAQRDSLRERLDRIRQDARQHKDHSHQLAVRLGSIKAQYDSTRQALERLRMQSERLTEKREQLSLNLEEGEAPLEELRLKLEELLGAWWSTTKCASPRTRWKTPTASCARQRSAAPRLSSKRNCCAASWNSNDWNGSR